MNRSTIILLAMLMLACTACEKGEVGPEGPQGIQGMAGADGTTILSGTTVPNGDIGTQGDFYLRLTNSMLYGPKTDQGWGSGTSLKGANGAKGPDGAKILSGTAAPTAAQGANGDFYFRTNTGVLYGPKAGNVWGSGTALKGPKGDKGDDGNANVQMFEIGRRTFTGSLSIELPIGNSDDKAFLVYYQTSSGTVGWIPAPGPGPKFGSAYKPLYYVKLAILNPRPPSSGIQLNFSLYLFENNASYSKSEVWEKIRVILLEPNEITKIASKGVDVQDYHQVKAALNIQ